MTYGRDIKPSPVRSWAHGERDARRRRENEAEEQLERKHQERAQFRQRLEDSSSRTRSSRRRSRNSARVDRGETELMLTSFPSSFCTDGCRAVNNADVPPISKPGKDAETDARRQPEWLATLPAGARAVYDYWKAHLQPGGFQFRRTSSIIPVAFQAM